MACCVLYLERGNKMSYILDVYKKGEMQGMKVFSSPQQSFEQMGS